MLPNANDGWFLMFGLSSTSHEERNVDQFNGIITENDR